MKNDSISELNGLHDSLKSVRQLRRSAWTSVLLMMLGVAIVIGSLIYSITKLRPLERQIGDKQNELMAATVRFNDLADKSYQLKIANEDAKVQLDETKREINLALIELEEIAKTPLPTSAKAVLYEAISKIRSANTTVSQAKADLETPKTASVPQKGRSRQTLIADLFSDQSSVRLRAYNGLMSDYSADPALVPELLSFARNHKDNLNGIYNTLVVLSHLNKVQLKPHVTEIEAFASDVKPLGPKIKERVDKLLSRLPR